MKEIRIRVDICPMEHLCGSSAACFVISLRVGLNFLCWIMYDGAEEGCRAVKTNRRILKMTECWTGVSAGGVRMGPMWAPVLVEGSHRFQLKAKFQGMR